MILKPWRGMLAVFVMMALLGGVFGPAQAGPPTPLTSPRPPIPPPQPLSEVQIWDGSSRNVRALSSLKAVLLVGPIDGDYGPWTTGEEQNMELAAVELEANGVTVHRFYTPNNDWGQITAAAEGAGLQGHGLVGGGPCGAHRHRGADRAGQPDHTTTARWRPVPQAGLVATGGEGDHGGGEHAHRIRR